MRPNWNKSWAGKGSELERLMRPFRQTAKDATRIIRSQRRKIRDIKKRRI